MLPVKEKWTSYEPPAFLFGSKQLYLNTFRIVINHFGKMCFPLSALSASRG